MVIGDDEIDAEALCFLCRGKGADAGVDADDEADAFGCGAREDFGLHTIAVAQAMRNMEANRAAEHFNCGLKQHDRSSTVDVVVPVDEDWLMFCDCDLDTSNCFAHAEHGVGIGQVIDSGLEERRGFGGGFDAAIDQKSGQGERDLRFSCKPLGVGRIDALHLPALIAGGYRLHEGRWGRQVLGRMGLRTHRELFFFGAVVDDQAAEARCVQQMLIAFVPLGGAFMQKHDTLVDEAKLDKAGLTDVVDQVFCFFKF